MELHQSLCILKLRGQQPWTNLFQMCVKSVLEDLGYQDFLLILGVGEEHRSCSMWIFPNRRASQGFVPQGAFQFLQHGEGVMQTKKSSFCCVICFSLQGWARGCQIPGEWMDHYVSSIFLWKCITCHRSNYYLLWKVLRRLHVLFQLILFYKWKTQSSYSWWVNHSRFCFTEQKKAIIFWLCICKHAPCNRHMEMSRKRIVQKSIANTSLGRKSL